MNRESNSELNTRIALARKEQIGRRKLYDPIEDDEIAGPIIRSVRKKVMMEQKHFVHGTCHIIWAQTKRILQEEHGISWFTPREMNPGVWFD